MLSIVYRRDTLGLTRSSASRGGGRCRFITLNIKINIYLFKLSIFINVL